MYKLLIFIKPQQHQKQTTSGHNFLVRLGTSGYLPNLIFELYDSDNLPRMQEERCEQAVDLIGRISERNHTTDAMQAIHLKLANRE